MFLRNGNMAEWMAEWMEGRQDPKTNKWITRIVIEAINLSGDGAPLGAKVQQFITLDSHLDFMDAIAVLSKYERGHIASGTLSAPDDIIDNLGKDHFIPFAESNGLIFDINGIPHPTMNGEIVTDGIFAKDAIARARAFYTKAPGAIRPANFFITTQSNTNANTTQMIDTTIDLMVALSNANELYNHIIALTEVTRIIFQNPDWGKIASKNIYLLKYDSTSINEVRVDYRRYGDSVQGDRINTDLTFLCQFMSKNGRLFEPHRDKSKLARLCDVYYSVIDEGCRVACLLGLMDDQKNQIVKNFETIRLYANVMHLRGALEQLANSPNDHHQRMLNEIKSAIPGLQERYTALSGTPDTGWKIGSTLFDDQIPDISPVFTELTNAAETVCTLLNRRLEQAKNQVISGPYAPTAAPSGPPSISLTLS